MSEALRQGGDRSSRDGIRGFIKAWVRARVDHYNGVYRDENGKVVGIVVPAPTYATASVPPFNKPIERGPPEPPFPATQREIEDMALVDAAMALTPEQVWGGDPPRINW